MSEAGASVYSASELAAKEFPIWTCPCGAPFPSRGGCSDPLAELVKIEPKRSVWASISMMSISTALAAA